GRCYLYGPDEPLKALAELGYEPFDDELTSEYLKRYCRNSHLPLKSQLLDQGMIAGIGNIYANEICFEVGMHPCHPASLLSREKWDEVIAATKKILGEAIKQGGTTIRSYTSSLGVTGLFQQQLHVHTKKDEPCEVCGEKIIKIAVNGRGTYFCPHCQKEQPVLAAVTGNIGSGKSTVMQKLQEMGYPTISCDAVNAGLLEKEDTRRKLATILACDWQEVNKPLIRERIFADETLRKEVESCLHELIWKEIQTFYESQTSRIVFVEVPLLFETDWYRRFELCILVRTSREALYQRLQRDRGMSEEAISTVLASQLSDEEKTGKADMVINNDGTLAKLEQSVEKAVHNIVKLLPEEV
ncbi:MAG: dephospho-CoA kinase, partial [Erysipelotrichaceae bacterium]|nr:dephospho-CoA kinase [Erysipelotrichaceae bacterium]